MVFRRRIGAHRRRSLSRKASCTDIKEYYQISSSRFRKCVLFLVPSFGPHSTIRTAVLTKQTQASATLSTFKAEQRSEGKTFRFDKINSREVAGRTVCCIQRRSLQRAQLKLKRVDEYFPVLNKRLTNFWTKGYIYISSNLQKY